MAIEEVTSQPGGDGVPKTGGKTQSIDRTEPGFEPTEDEKSVVKLWLQRVERAEKDEKRLAWKALLTELRGYVSGEKHEDKTNKKLVRSNMVFSTISAMMPQLYAKNPDMAVTPTDAVPAARMGQIKKFSKTAQAVLSKVLIEEPRLKKRAKANIRSVSTTSYGVLKMVYQKELRGDPLVIRRIEDTQDNLARIEMQARELKESDDPAKIAEQRDIVKANLKALLSQNEVKIFKGFVIDRVKSEDFVVLDDDATEFDDYLEASANGQLLWMPVRRFKLLFNMDPHGATKYAAPRSDATTSTPDTMKPDDMFVCVVEIWDKENGVVRTTAKGMNRWVRDVYAPPCTPLRWYPFYVLGFNLIEGRWRPISDVELLMGLQDEYNTTRTNYADVREKAVPKRIIRKSGNLPEDDILNIVNSGNKDWIAVEGLPTVPISQDVMQLDGLRIDPAAYDVTLIRNDMDLMVGMSDAGRANLIKPKTATEAELMQEALQSRVGERRDTHEDMLSEMGEAALEVCLRDFTKEEVMQLAGEEAEWPDNPQSVDEIQRMVSVRVRAGSSGKPNQAKEREQWSQLLPIITDAMKQIAELRLQGMYEQADAMLELLRETLRRFDEHLDLDSIIPPIEKDANGKPVAAGQAAAQLAKTSEDLQKCQEELQKCKEDLAKAQSGEQANIAKINADNARAQAQEQAKAQLEQQDAALDAQREEADAQRASTEALAKQATETAKANADAAKAQAENARHERETNAKMELDKHAAILKAAVQLMGDEIAAAAQARTADAEAQVAAEERGFSEERFTKMITDLSKTMEGLGKSFDGMLSDSKARTALVKQHLGKE